MTVTEVITGGLGLLGFGVACITAYATWAAPTAAERFANELRRISSESEFRARLKFDCLRRVAGYRATPIFPPEFFAAMNEAFVVFNDSEPVLRALISLQRGGGTAQGNYPLLDLMKAMLDDLRLGRRILDDDFLLTPFGPKNPAS